MTPQQNIKNTVAAQGETGAMAVYSGLRILVMGAYAKGERAPEGARVAMAFAGDALAEMIGEDRLERLQDQIDAQFGF
jgi:hypothetical protein